MLYMMVKKCNTPTRDNKVRKNDYMIKEFVDPLESQIVEDKTSYKSH